MKCCVFFFFGLSILVLICAGLGFGLIYCLLNRFGIGIAGLQVDPCLALVRSLSLSAAGGEPSVGVCARVGERHER